MSLRRAFVYISSASTIPSISMGSGVSSDTVADAKSREGLEQYRQQQRELERLRGTVEELQDKNKTLESENKSLKKELADYKKNAEETVQALEKRLQISKQKLDKFRKGQEIMNTQLAAAVNHQQQTNAVNGTGRSSTSDALERRQEVCAEVDVLDELNHVHAADEEPFSWDHIKKTDEELEVIHSAVAVSILFTAMDEDQLEDVVSAMHPVDVKSNDVIIKQNDDDAIFYIIEKGEFDILVTADGEEECVAQMSRGNSFGELALMYNCKRTATVAARQDGRLWAIERQVFQGILHHTGQARINEYRQFLHKVPLLESLGDTALTKLTSAIEVYKYMEGDVIVREGEEGNMFFFIKHGTVVVCKDEMQGGQSLQVQSLGEGDFFGEMALLNDDPRAATVCATSEVECLTLNRHAFKKLLGPLQQLKDHGEERQKELEAIDFSGANKGIAVSSDTPINPLRTDIAMEDLKELTLLGAGAFGRVTLVQSAKTNETFALKALDMTKVVKLRQIQHVMNEKNIMLKVQHPFIQRLYATFKSRSNLYMLIEVSLGGELFTLLRSHRRFNKQWTLFYAASVVLVFEFLHGLGIVYRDLKPENLLLDKNGYLKVIDFGFAKNLGGKRTFTLCGTPDYLAPEILKNTGHDKAVDWWALGILIYEMLAGKPPFESKDHMDTYKKILGGKVEFGPYFNKPEADLIKRLLSLDQSKRIGNLKEGAKDVKAHKCFEGFDFDALLTQTMAPPYKPVVKDITDSSNFMVHPSLQHEEKQEEVSNEYLELFADF